MNNYRGLDAPRGPLYYRFWGAVFVALLLGFVFVAWKASTGIDYNWRWERVPQYFWTEKAVEIRADSPGTVKSIAKDDKGQYIVLRANDSDETTEILVPAGARVLPDKGDLVYSGDILASYHLSGPGLLLEALWLTLWISMLAIAVGMVIGLGAGLARISDNPALRWSAVTYIELVRGSPLLVQMYLLYFVAGPLINYILREMGLTPLGEIWYGVISLAVFAGAYVAEITRAGIQSVHRGQMEAARSLGMTYNKAMRKVILPQAFRRILPPLAGQFISLVKDSSLLGVITVRELTKATREVVTTTMQPFELWITCALLYLVLTFTLSLFVQYLEKRAVR